MLHGHSAIRHFIVSQNARVKINLVPRIWCTGEESSCTNGLGILKPRTNRGGGRYLVAVSAGRSTSSRGSGYYPQKTNKRGPAQGRREGQRKNRESPRHKATLQTELRVPNYLATRNGTRGYGNRSKNPPPSLKQSLATAAFSTDKPSGRAYKKHPQGPSKSKPNKTHATKRV